MRLRASSSSKSAPRAGAAANASASKRRASADALSPQRQRAIVPSLSAGPLFAGVHHVVATVLGPRAFIVPRIARLLLAEAHRLDLVVGGTVERHHALHLVGPALPQRDVVLAAAALVAVALHRHARGPVALQILRVSFDQRLELVL